MTIRDALREAIDYMPANTVSERARRHRWEATLAAERARPVPDGLREAAMALVDEWDAAMAGDMPLNGHYQKQALDRLRAALVANPDRPVPPDGRHNPDEEALRIRLKERGYDLVKSCGHRNWCACKKRPDPIRNIWGENSHDIPSDSLYAHEMNKKYRNQYEKEIDAD